MNLRSLTVVLLLVLACTSLVLMAQDVTKKETKAAGPAEKTVKVERAEVVYVSGNDVVVKMETGEVRHITVPEGKTALVDGKEITVKDLKAGMKLQKTVTTTTIPQTVTTMRTIQGKVWSVQPPNSVILTLPDNTNKKYNIPKNQKFMVGGEEKTAFDLKKGMSISATVLVQTPVTKASIAAAVTGTAPVEVPAQVEPTLLIEAPAPAPKAEAAPAPTPAPAAEPAPQKLPKTGSLIPLLGLLGLLSCSLSLGLGAIRRSR
jgi:hypothetical protein